MGEVLIRDATAGCQAIPQVWKLSLLLLRLATRLYMNGGKTACAIDQQITNWSNCMARSRKA
jgi:hypothetical protein